ncbi:MAG: hypothetical protein WDM77_09655 [Steroidobacteraceae bacterium]
MTDRTPLVTATKRGLYCPPGDFYIDPAKAVQTAVVTHAHGDHLREGSSRLFMAVPGVGIARKRLKDARNVVPVEYGTSFTLGSVSLSLHPAGHILGSAQVRLEHEGQVWVVSGDYKRQLDPTCAPFQPLECDVFVSETTFGQPHFVWPETYGVVGNIVRWWQINRERGHNSVLFCYALGKAQRVLAEMLHHTRETVHVHGEIGTLVEVYRNAGIDMVPTVPVTATSARRTAGRTGHGHTDHESFFLVATPGTGYPGILFGVDAAGGGEPAARLRYGIRGVRPCRLARAGRHLPGESGRPHSTHARPHRSAG